MAEIASRAPEAAGETLLSMRGMDLAKSMPRACVPVMAIWSPFRNKPRFWPRHHSNLTAARPRFSLPDAC